MAFRWRADDGPTLNAGLVALLFFSGSGPVLLRNPIFCCDFSVGVWTPCPTPPHPPLWICTCSGLPPCKTGWKSDSYLQKNQVCVLSRCALIISFMVKEMIIPCDEIKSCSLVTQREISLVPNGLPVVPTKNPVKLMRENNNFSSKWFYIQQTTLYHQ